MNLDWIFFLENIIWFVIPIIFSWAASRIFKFVTKKKKTGWFVFLALLSFTWYPSRVKITSTTASAIGFIIFSIMAFAIIENAGACVVILSMFLLVDFLWALFLKLTFIDKYRNIIDNTCYQQALGEGMSPEQASSFAIRAQVLVLFFGCFQAYSPNQGSLIAVSFFIIVWFCYKFKNMPTSPQSLKDINTQVFEELQDRMNEIKEFVRKDKDEED